MSEPTCPYCGDGMESIGTLNHIECVAELQATVDRLKQGCNCAEFNGYKQDCNIDLSPCHHHSPCHFTPPRWAERSTS